MIFLMFIGFFTSRLLLQLLGVEDYGIYSLVGSVLASFSALKSIFTESIQRFLNFEKGNESIEKQRDIYTMSIYIHIVLAIALFIIIELIGTWLINFKLVIPEEKLPITLFVFHVSVISVIFSILSITFDAVIIANERMDVYAYFSIFEGVFKVVVLLILPKFDVVHLRMYALALMFCPIFYLIVSYRFTRRFAECKIQKHLNKEMFKSVALLSGWNFFGNISFSILHEGINFILNAFGGLVYNAARGIAYQIKSIVAQVSNNMLIAARPMIMQRAASDGKEDLFRNIITISRLSFFLMLLTVAPIITFTPSLLSIWLKDVPEYSDIFTKIVLIGILIRSLHEPINILYMSNGNIKRMMIIEVVTMLSSIILIYVLLASGYPMITAFIILTLMEVMIILALFINAIYEIHFLAKEYIVQVLVPMSVMIAIFLLISIGFSHLNFPASFVSTLLQIAIFELLLIGILILFLNSRERALFINIFNRISLLKKLKSNSLTK